MPYPTRQSRPSPTDRFEANLDKIDKELWRKFNHPKCKVVDEGGLPTLEVHSQHAFTQAVGYVKFSYKDHFSVLYRGQSKNYGALKPSIFRGIQTDTAIHNRNKKINDFLAGANHLSLFINGTPDHAREGILQHYGINTRWIDLVDNHWIALWFSAHKFYSTNDRYNSHFERREDDDEGGYAYILLLGAPRFWINRAYPGQYSDTDSQLIDLRVAAPSLYLRPHSQHALLMRRVSYAKSADTDLQNRVVGVIRIPLKLVKEWLGVGGLIGPSSLFPPPYYDRGYQQLLEHRPKHTDELGTITFLYSGI
jgi:hypothetical protein